MGLVKECEGCSCHGMDDDENTACTAVRCTELPETKNVIWVPYKKNPKLVELETAVLSLLEYFESGNSVPVQQATIKADSPEIRKLRELVGKPCT